MNRDESLKKLRKTAKYEVIVIGGGASGLGVALDAASRGLSTLLVEQNDFAKATSSRSTKLIHGGLRYLQQGNISLVTEALKERGRLVKNAPHMIHHLPFLVPNYKWWEGPFYGFGLKIYDALAGSLGLEKSKHLSKDKTLETIPSLKQEDLRGGVIYYDGQFDDARLAITIARTCDDLGATLLNYMRFDQFLKHNGKVSGIKATDLENGESYEILADVVINATGIYSDQVRQLDQPEAKKRLQLSQGVHLVLKGELLRSDHAILVPHTDDGRVLFMVPWHGRVLAGTTDVAVDKPLDEPIPTKEEIAFIMEEGQKYLAKPLQKSDILSVFAGLRPLAKVSDSEDTSKISRDHIILTSDSGLISILGGKWTIFRQMGEDVIDHAIKNGQLSKRTSKTEDLKLHGYKVGLDPRDSLSTYGSDLPLLLSLGDDTLLHPNLPYLKSEVVWACRYAMARQLEDVLSRRTRSLLLDAKATIEIAPEVAQIMAQELNKDQTWIDEQVKQFQALAQHYLP